MSRARRDVPPVAVDSVHDRQSSYQAYKDFERRRELGRIAGQLRMLEKLMPAIRAAGAEIYGDEVFAGVQGGGIRIEEGYAANSGRRSGVSRNEVIERVLREHGAREIKRSTGVGSTYWVQLQKGHLRVAMWIRPAIYTPDGWASL